MKLSVDCKNEIKPLIDTKIEIQYICAALFENNS